MDEVHRIIVGRGGFLQIGQVGGRTETIGLRSFLIPANALHDVRGHMHEVAGAGHHLPERLGRS